jgi:hypothetical protein
VPRARPATGGTAAARQDARCSQGVLGLEGGERSCRLQEARAGRGGHAALLAALPHVLDGRSARPLRRVRCRRRRMLLENFGNSMTPLEKIAAQILAKNPFEVRSLVQDYLRRGAPVWSERAPDSNDPKIRRYSCDRRANRYAYGAASACMGESNRQASNARLSGRGCCQEPQDARASSKRAPNRCASATCLRLRTTSRWSRRRSRQRSGARLRRQGGDAPGAGSPTRWRWWVATRSAAEQRADARDHGWRGRGNPRLAAPAVWA